MKYKRMPIEIESPEEYGYDKIKYNLSESSIADQSLESLNLQIPSLTLLYNEHRGATELRSLIAEDAGVTADDVLITSGAAGALFIIATSQLGAKDSSGPGHLVVVRPNYATNLETPKALERDISSIDLTFEGGFQPSIDANETSIKDNTRLEMVESWIEGEELLEWVKPTGGVVCFPRIKKEPAGGLAEFYDRLLKKHATYMGPGHWFELSDSFFRLGYGWPTREELAGGMKAISAALRDA